MDAATQCGKILAYCEEHGSITAREAFIHLNINSPRKAISTIKQKGYQVKTVEVYNNGKKPYHRYYISKKEGDSKARKKVIPMIRVGQKVRFDAFEHIKSSVEKIKEQTVGTVVYVNEPHKWFSVQYGKNQRTSFKFFEVGEKVHICK